MEKLKRLFGINKNTETVNNGEKVDERIVPPHLRGRDLSREVVTDDKFNDWQVRLIIELTGDKELIDKYKDRPFPVAKEDKDVINRAGEEWVNTGLAEAFRDFWVEKKRIKEVA